MGFRYLSDAEMLELSGAWLDKARTRPAFEAAPLYRALLSEVARVHAALASATAAQGAPGDNTAALPALRAQAVADDARFDRKARGTYWLLGALAELTDDAGAAQGFRALRDRLLPRGLAVTQGTYEAEAGEARVLSEKLDAATRTALKKIALPWRKTLGDEVSAWISAGAALGKAAAKSAAVAGEVAAAKRGGSALAAVQAARRAWVSLAQAVVHNAPLAGELTAAQRAAILEPLARAAERSDARDPARGRRGAKSGAKSAGGSDKGASMPGAAAAPTARTATRVPSRKRTGRR